MSEPTRPNKAALSRGQKITIATVLTAGLAAGGFAAADASFASGGSGSSSGSTSSSGKTSSRSSSPKPPAPPAAPSRYDLDGTVTAVSSHSITVRDPFGTMRTYTPNGSTTVRQGPKKSSVGSLAIGDRVMVHATKSGSGYVAEDIDRHLAHIDGVVASVSGDTVTVTDPDGFTRSVALSSSTSYTKDGKSAERSAVTHGSVVHAEGKVGSDHTTLDASTVDIRTKDAQPPASPAGGPAGAATRGVPAALPRGNRKPGRLQSGTPKPPTAPTTAPTSTSR